MPTQAFKSGYAEIDWSDTPRHQPRGAIHARHARADLPTPMLIHGFVEPVKSMADGKYYSTKSALEASYKASGNPQGKDYDCIGDDPMPTFKRPKSDRKATRDAVEKAIDDVASGNVPDVLTTDTFKL